MASSCVASLILPRASRNPSCRRRQRPHEPHPSSSGIALNWERISHTWSTRTATAAPTASTPVPTKRSLCWNTSGREESRKSSKPTTPSAKAAAAVKLHVLRRAYSFVDLPSIRLKPRSMPLWELSDGRQLSALDHRSVLQLVLLRRSGLGRRLPEPIPTQHPHRPSHVFGNGPS